MESGDIKFEYETNDFVYYSLVEGYTLHRVKANPTDGPESGEMAIVGKMQSTLWSSYDFATIDGKLCALYFNDGDDIDHINYMYMSWFENDDKDTVSAKRIGLLGESEQKYVLEEGDDAYAIADEFASAE